MRWTAFLSIFVEIFLKLIAKPLKKLGLIVENFLNSCTQRDSKDYYSIFGFIDTRFDFDKKIQHGDAKYYPALSMMASKLAYENQAVVQTTISERWKMDFVDFYNFYNEFKQKSTTQAFIFHNENIDDGMIVVAFRGTSLFSAEDWSTDFNYPGVKIEGIPGKTHFGYMLALGLNKYSRDNYNDDYLGNISGTWPKQIEQDPKRPLAYYTLREKLKEMISRYKNTKIIVTGHSFGGALAVLFPAVLALHGEVELLDKMEGIYTYGQPRVGDGHFGNFMKNNVIREHNIKYYRIVYGYDIVPQLPPRDDATKSFKHFGTALRFNSFYHGKIIEEESNDIPRIVVRLLSTLILAIIARIVAVWQFIRGLFIGYIAGPEYRESWLLLGLRFIIGILFFPRAIDHLFQDYVNSTRIASDYLFENYPANLALEDSP